MPFTTRVKVTNCYNCPHQIQGYNTVLICGEISTHPEIAYNGILSNCPYNKKEKDLIPISDYGKSRQ